jgi:hypothetical protein
MVSAAALETIAFHPLDRVTLNFRAMLAGGLLLVAIGISLAVWRALRVIAAERIGGTIAIAGFVLAAGSISGLTLLGLVVTAMLIGLTIESMRINFKPGPSSVTDHA